MSLREVSASANGDIGKGSEVQMISVMRNGSGRRKFYALLFFRIINTAIMRSEVLWEHTLFGDARVANQ